MIINPINPEGAIEYYRGLIDIYLYKNLIWIARTWPKKIKPPYSTTQATFQSIFSLSKKAPSIFSDIILYDWKTFKSKSLPNWYDQIVQIFMNYYLIYKTVVPIATDRKIETSGNTIRIVYTIYYDYDLELNNGKTKEKTTEWFDLNYINSFNTGIYISVFDETGTRICAPWTQLKN